ncbi:unnamed protein product, partial [Penicillium bialowiezense]
MENRRYLDLTAGIKPKPPSRSDMPDEDEEEVIVANKFSTLSLDSKTKAEGKEEISYDGSELEDIDSAATKTANEKSLKKRNKGEESRKRGEREMWL